VQQTPVQLGTPDCPVVHRTVSGAPGWSVVNSSLSGFDGGLWLKITGLSGEPTVASANGWLRNLRAMRGSSNGRQCAPDCPVRQRVWRCNGRLRPIWKEIEHRTGYSSCPVAHWTVRCATRQKAGIAFQDYLQRLLAVLGL
jgi:hypothetical protein